MAKRKIEDITDIIEKIKARYTPEHFADMKIKKGKVLTFDYEGSPVVLKIVRISRDGKYFAEHVELFEPKAVATHYGHNVDTTGAVPYCTDCEVGVSEPATKAGRAKYEERKERHLADGTPIEEEPNEDY